MVEIVVSQTSMTTKGDPSRPYIEGNCLYGDDKPMDCATGSKLLEADTGNVYFFNGIDTWNFMFTFKDGSSPVVPESLGSLSLNRPAVQPSIIKPSNIEIQEPDICEDRIDDSDLAEDNKPEMQEKFADESEE